MRVDQRFEEEGIESQRQAKHDRENVPILKRKLPGQDSQSEKIEKQGNRAPQEVSNVEGKSRETTEYQGYKGRIRAWSVNANLQRIDFVEYFLLQRVVVDAGRGVLVDDSADTVEVGKVGVQPAYQVRSHPGLYAENYGDRDHQKNNKAAPAD